MERTIKYLYYRGVRHAAGVIIKNTNKVKQLTYRGAKLIERVSDVAIHHSTVQKMYRGAAY